MTLSRRALIVGLLVATPVLANLGSLAVSITYRPNPPSNGSTINVTASGGAAPYTIRLFVNGVLVDICTSDMQGKGTVKVYSGASGDPYDITATDANGVVGTTSGNLN